MKQLFIVILLAFAPFLSEAQKRIYPIGLNKDSIVIKSSTLVRNDGKHYISNASTAKNIKYMNVAAAEGIDTNTIYFVPKSHLILKEGQLFVSKFTGNTAKEPELNDRVEGFMQDGSGNDYYVIGKYNGTGSFFLKSNYTIIDEEAW